MPLYRIALAALVSGLLATPALAATVQVNQVGLTFDPADITINVGDTVEWVWTTGVHTVTNGTGAADPNVGILFDDALTVGNPTPSYTFTTVGDVDYFCRPHEFFNMNGIIRVQSVGQPVPTLGEWAFGATALLMLAAGFVMARRRSIA